MEIDKIQKSRKFQRIGNDDIDAKKLGQKRGETEPLKRNETAGGGGAGGSLIAGGVISRLCGWPSSRIVRVSRASGGKDRHSKVWTSKGLRDRRVRLSVTTAIQFYDLQDRLGYDQPSKAIEWLLKKAADSISELPSLDASFPDTPKQTENGVEDGGFDTDIIEFNQQTACSSTSETSKGSAGLSLSRSENRIKARERARERAAEKEKEKETESQIGVLHQNQPQSSSFTELLTGVNTVTNDTHNVTRSSQMDYFIYPPTASRTLPSLSSWGNNNFPGFNVAGDQNQFSFVNENLVPIMSSSVGEYNLNFSISSGLAGFNRGTLQSNTPSFYPHHIQRFSPLDGSNIPSFSPLENHNHHQIYQTGFDGRLQLRFGDNVGRYSDQKGKEKN
jgi:hypothetical protein